MWPQTINTSIAKDNGLELICIEQHAECRDANVRDTAVMLAIATQMFDEVMRICTTHSLGKRQKSNPSSPTQGLHRPCIDDASSLILGHG